MTESLRLLSSCGDREEAEALRALLAAHEIPAVVQGGESRAVFGMLGALIEVRVLVPAAAFERAQELLASVPEEVPDGLVRLRLAGPEAAIGVCPVHERDADLSCTRCGTFLCAACPVMNREAPVCEACEDRAHDPNRRRNRRRTLALFVIALMVAPAALRTLWSLLWAMAH